MPNQEMEQQREFTGVWIPAQVIEDESLTAYDLIVYAQIASFQVCTASNEYLAKIAHISARTVRRSIVKLESSGYIRVRTVTTAANYSRRHIVVEPRQIVMGGMTACHGGYDSVSPNNKEDNKEDIVILDKSNITRESADSSDLEAEPVESYGNSEINEFIALWEQEIGVPITSRVQKNRYAINRMLKKYGHQGLSQLIHAAAVASSDRYAPSISSFEDLEKKLSQLLLWAKKRSTTTTSRAVTEANYTKQQETNDIIVEGF